MKPTERIAYWALRIVTYLIVLVVGYIIFDIVIKGTPALSIEFLRVWVRENNIRLEHANSNELKSTLEDDDVQ